MMSYTARKWGGIKIFPIGCETLGVRGFSFVVSTPDVQLLLDPSCALGPRRGFPDPHPFEFQRVRAVNRMLLEYAKNASHVFYSHYHQDHYKPIKRDCYYNYTTPSFARAVPAKKTIYHKDPYNQINRSQGQRAEAFFRNIRQECNALIPCDGETVAIGDTVLKFSPPVPHGEPGSYLGFVVMIAIQHGSSCAVFAPDVQGPQVNDTTKWICELKPCPKVAFIGGPPTYLQGEKVPLTEIERARQELNKLEAVIPEVVVDHHLMRSPTGESWLREDFSSPVNSKIPQYFANCVARTFGGEPLMLEANRNLLFKDFPPGEKWQRWYHLSRETKTTRPPPLDDPPFLAEYFKSNEHITRP